VDLEGLWEGFLRETGQEGHVNYVPTMVGGVGEVELEAFHREYFALGRPKSMVVRLVSRTVGIERVVDEMMVEFEHSQAVPWMLPGVPPTGRRVRVAVVAVVRIRGGKLCHEHVYWDQASVLVQIGLLDPKLVPKSMREQGLERLPVVGAEAARKVLDERSEPSNELLMEWKNSMRGEAVATMPARPKPAANVE
jgi:hypothetical protein